MDIPNKKDDRGWRELRNQINESYPLQRDQMAKYATQRKHQIERRILELQDRPANADRDTLIQELRTEMEQL